MKQNSQDDPSTYYQPEYVILEDNENDKRKEHEQYESIFLNLKKIKSNWMIHVMAFFAFIITSILAAASLCFFTFNLLLAAIGLFKNVKVNEAVLKSWKNLKKICAIGMGMAIAVLSPTLGFGFIFLYFVLHNETLDSRFVDRFMNPFNHQKR